MRANRSIARLLTAFFALLFLCPGHPAIAGERIEIPGLGLVVTMPDGWHVVADEAHRENIRRAFQEQNTQELLLRYATTPIIAFAKYPEPHDGLNPSFRITVRPAGTTQGRSAREILSVVLPNMGRLLGEFETDQAITEMQVSRLPAAYARLRYRLHVNGVSYPAVSAVWIVPRGAELFIIGAGWAGDEPTQTRVEIETIVSGLILRAARP